MKFIKKSIIYLPKNQRDNSKQEVDQRARKEDLYKVLVELERKFLV